MAQALQDKELLRQSPSVKPMKKTTEPAADTCGGGSQPDPGTDQRRGPHAPSLPWTDYVCNITLRTEEEATAHFRLESHRVAVYGFLAKHKIELEANDPLAITILSNTLPTRREISFAEKLAVADRTGGGPTPSDNPPTPSDRSLQPRSSPPAHPTSGGATSLTKMDPEEYGRRLMDLGKGRTIGPHLYQIGLEETLHWEGRYKDMPTPAVCIVCNNKDLPNNGRLKHTANLESTARDVPNEARR